MSEPKITYLGPVCEADIGDCRMNNQWKLVPVEPTETMVINGFESVPNECFTDEEVWQQYQEMSGCQQAAFRARLCWAAMLASSPAPATSGVPEIVAYHVVDEFGQKKVLLPGAEGIKRHRTRGATLRELTDIDQVRRLVAERDALQLRLNAADQRIDELVSAVRSINRGRRHEVFVPGDDEPQYRQRKEWVDWVLSLCDEASASERCHEIPGTSGIRLNTLANQGE